MLDSADPGSDADNEPRQLRAIVQFGSKEKREAAREANEYLKAFTQHVDEQKLVLTTQLQDLTAASYAPPSNSSYTS